MYAMSAQLQGLDFVGVPLTADFALDVPAMLAAVAQTQPAIVYLAYPNNPTANVWDAAVLRRLIAQASAYGALVVLDEAYVEFALAPGGGPATSRTPWVLRHANLAVLRTFSKRAGLAGLRIGYGAFPAGLTPLLMKAKQPYNVAVTAERAALAALANPGYLARVRDLLVAERARLSALLAATPGLHPYPSQANFVLARVDGGADAAATLRRRLAEEHGIMVRYYSQPAALAGCIRVSVGKPEHTDALERALRIIMGHA
jgi:histidinol-phosphate aminotransferase